MAKLLRFNDAHYIHFVTSKYTISYIMMRIKGYSARLINLAEVGYGLAEAEPSAKRETFAKQTRQAEAEPSAKRADNIQCFDNKRSGEVLASPCQNVWQKSFYDIQIYSDKFLQQKLDYIHNNPLRAGLVKNLDDYPWSSYQNYYLENNSLIRIDYRDG